MTTVVMPTRGRAESEALTRALINLASKGLRPHCSDPGTSELWLSDHPAERREAVKVCAGCPVIVECRTAAEARDERWHVWGGHDYTRRQKAQRAA
jgi:Transcription factor WhiB